MDAKAKEKYFLSLSHRQTSISVQCIIACSISTHAEKGLEHFLYLFVLAAHPYLGVLIDLHSFLNLKSALNSVHNPVVSHVLALINSESGDSLRVMDEE